MLSDSRIGSPGRRSGSQARVKRTIGRPGFQILVATIVLALAIAQQGTAQTSAASTRSTMMGVYTAAQARRGEDTYMSICVACHPSGTYSTAAFKATWAGRPLSDLFGLISETMPKIDPGSLTPQEYAQVVAYILKVNDVPPGKTELPADGDRMKQIRIEMPGARLGKNHGRR
jgi:mono/diheme cytochrome c family protein